MYCAYSGLRCRHANRQEKRYHPWYGSTRWIMTLLGSFSFGVRRLSAHQASKSGRLLMLTNITTHSTMMPGVARATHVQFGQTLTPTMQL